MQLGAPDVSEQLGVRAALGDLKRRGPFRSALGAANRAKRAFETCKKIDFGVNSDKALKLKRNNKV